MVQIILAFLMGGLLMINPAFANTVKQPNVSGQFYSGTPAQLSAEIDRYLQAAKVNPTDKAVDVLIVPHAGYMYSGPVAAYGYKALSGKSYKTVVVLAPSHYVGFDGIAVWPGSGMATPLGTIDVDKDFVQALLQRNPKYLPVPQPFEKEHSLEVELPFLQKTFQGFKIVPVVMGQVDQGFCRQLAADLNTVIGDRQDVLVVVSSDMSHYYDDSTARVMDRAALQAIEHLNIDGFWQGCAGRKTMEMCGFVPVTVAMYLARERGLEPEILHYANSGDVTGEKDRVVGYSAILFGRPSAAPVPASAPAAEQGKILPLTVEQKKELLTIAKTTMETYVRTGKEPAVKTQDPRLRASEGAFVTIHKHGQLRGCIGHIVTDAPLYQTVRDMAVAATMDSRFRLNLPGTTGYQRLLTVMPEDLDQLDMEISVLSQPWEIKSLDEIQLGVHGVIIGHGVFLPQVAEETGWSLDKFLSELCFQKAGLPPDAWKNPKTRISIFTADVFSAASLQP